MRVSTISHYISSGMAALTNFFIVVKLVSVDNCLPYKHFLHDFVAESDTSYSVFEWFFASCTIIVTYYEVCLDKVFFFLFRGTSCLDKVFLSSVHE